jgi:predicted dehydrogenase
MVKEARYRVARGDFGKIRRIYVEYPQGWLADAVSESENKQAGWRVDPKRSGIAGCMGDIGTHCFNLVNYITGLKAVELCAELNTFVPGRLLDDDGVAMIRYEGGAKGLLAASQVAVGEENDFFIRIYGEKGGLEWHQEKPNTLLLKWSDRPNETIYTSNGYASETSRFNSRTPAGHPEGYIEAFANIYRNFALTLQSRLTGEQPKPETLDFPTVYDGVNGMEFIEAVVAASKSDKKWTPLGTKN